MISRLRGKAVAWDADGLVLDVSGVGYRLFATPAAVEEGGRRGRGRPRDPPARARGRAPALRLRDADERELFEQLLSVSGVGPKVALAIVSGYSPGELRRAIVREDDALFQTIPGIGKKTAQRVVLELKEKIAPLAAVEAPHLGAGDGHIVARDALVELGYSRGGGRAAARSSRSRSPAGRSACAQALRAA